MSNKFNSKNRQKQQVEKVKKICLDNINKKIRFRDLLYIMSKSKDIEPSTKKEALKLAEQEAEKFIHNSSIRKGIKEAIMSNASIKIGDFHVHLSYSLGVDSLKKQLYYIIKKERKYYKNFVIPFISELFKKNKELDKVFKESKNNDSYLMRNIGKMYTTQKGIDGFNRGDIADVLYKYNLEGLKRHVMESCRYLKGIGYSWFELRLCPVKEGFNTRDVIEAALEGLERVGVGICLSFLPRFNIKGIQIKKFTSMDIVRTVDIIENKIKDYRRINIIDLDANSPFILEDWFKKVCNRIFKMGITLTFHTGEFIPYEFNEGWNYTREGGERQTERIDRLISIICPEKTAVREKIRFGHAVALGDYNCDGLALKEKKRQVRQKLKKYRIVIESCPPAYVNDMLDVNEYHDFSFHTFMKENLTVKLGTDWPGTLQTTVLDEYIKLVLSRPSDYRFDLEDIKKVIGKDP